MNEHRNKAGGCALRFGGGRSVYGFGYLAAMRPCANCKEERKERERSPLALPRDRASRRSSKTPRWWGATPSISSGGVDAAQPQRFARMLTPAPTTNTPTIRLSVNADMFVSNCVPTKAPKAPPTISQAA